MLAVSDFSLTQERCAGAETISLIARVLHKSKVHFQSMLMPQNASVIEDFYENLVILFCPYTIVSMTSYRLNKVMVSEVRYSWSSQVDCVPDLTEHIHRTTARMLLHING